MTDPKITDIRMHFHNLVDKLTVIIGVAGVWGRMNEVKNYNTMTKEELLKEIHDMREQMNSIKKVGTASHLILAELKTSVYKEMKIDNSKPLKQL